MDKKLPTKFFLPAVLCITGSLRLTDLTRSGMKVLQVHGKRRSGRHYRHDVEKYLPEDITCLRMSPAAMRAYDVSGMGFGEEEPLQDNLLTFNERHLTRQQERQYEHKDDLSVRVVKDLR